MSSTYGKNLKISIFGQSHSSGIGVTIDGLPAGERIDFDELKRFLSRRAPGQNEFSTPRKEEDLPDILCGLVNNTTCGAPLTAVIYNKNTKSEDYKNIMDIPRPSHADFVAHIKYKGFNDVSGGGHFSGRLTAPLCVAGGIAQQILKRRGIEVVAQISSIGKVQGQSLDKINITKEEIEKIKTSDFPTLNSDLAEKMKDEIRLAKSKADSIGGCIECAILGVPVGIGNPMFDGIENKISQIVFGIPAIKGIEFGNGFDCAKLFGSENNDEFYIEDDTIKTKTNNSGGINGGISNGMPIIFKVAVKPTASIGIEQNSISFEKNENAKLVIKGRHDPCIVQRAVPCVEAAAAIAILDMLLD